MRQGGFKPKSHKSGTYWIRANAKGGGKKKKVSINQKNEGEDKLELPKFLDPDGDGKISYWEWAQSIIVIVGVISCFVGLTILGEM
jgi:hypothetical protein